MAKKQKTGSTTKKSPIQRIAKRPEHKVYTYRVIAPGRNPELVQCHSMNVYGGSVEFVRRVQTPHDPFEELTILAIPTHALTRVELVEDAVETIALSLGAVDDITEVPSADPAAAS